MPLISQNFEIQLYHFWLKILFEGSLSFDFALLILADPNVKHKGVINPVASVVEDIIVLILHH